MEKHAGDAWRFLALIGLTLALIAFSAWLASTGQLTVESVQRLVRSGGIWSPVVYLVIATVLPVAFVPRWLLTAAAAALFGFIAGAALGLLGGLGGAVSGYMLGWKLGHAYVERRSGQRVKTMMEFISRHGFMAIVLGRVSPAMSCELVSLASGITAIPMRTYLAASLVGMIPGSILYSMLGAGLVTSARAKVTMWYAVLFTILSIATGIWFWFVWKADQVNSRQSTVDSPNVEPEFVESTAPR